MHVQEQMEHCFLLREKQKIQNTWQKGACFSLQSHENHCDSGGTYMQNNSKVRVNRKKRLETEELSIITVRDWIIKKQN